MVTKIKKTHTIHASIAIILVAILTLVYWNHFDNDFHFDDSHTIVNNQYITDISNLPLFFKDARTTSSLPTNQAYRPVITSLNAIDYWLAGGMNPKVFHWHIYLEFLLLLSLLYLLMSKIFSLVDGKQHTYLALFATAFFAFHTATAETINYIIARSDGFSTLMVLAGMLLYVHKKGWKKQLGLIPLIIGCLAKPTALMLAPILFVYDLLLEHPALTIRSERPNFVAKILGSLKNTGSYFVLGAGMYFFTRSMYPDTWSPSNTSVLDYLITQPYIVWVYLKTFVLPTGISADTDLGLIKSVLSLKVLWGLLVIFIMLLIAWLTSRKRKTLPIAFGILWFFICLIPTSTIIPLAEVMNHHRTFFPYIGLTMAATWGGFLLFQRFVGEFPTIKSKIVLSLIMGAIISAHAYGTYQRNEVWDSEESLWLDVTVKSPKNGRGLMNYGLVKMRAGDMEQAIHFYERALKTDYGKHPYLYINLGIATNALSDRSNDSALKLKAEEYLKTGLQLGSRYPETHYYYADWLHKNGKSSQALVHVRKAIELSPSHKSARELLNQIVQAVDIDINRAATDANMINTPEAFINLSLQYYEIGNYEQSIEAAESALSRRPNYAEAYNNICAALNNLKQYQKAVEACEKALAIRPDYDLASGNLNWAKSQIKKGQ